MNRSSFGATVLASLLGGMALAEPADIVLRGGRVWAGKGLREGTAIALGGERVLAVGDMTSPPSSGRRPGSSS